MVKIAICLVLVAVAAVSSAYPFDEYRFDGEEVSELDAPAAAAYQDVYRLKRSLQPGAPRSPNAPGKSGGWSVNPNVSGDNRGNKRVDVAVQHKGKNHEVNAGWGKVVRGPNKSKPTWHVGGSYKW